MNQNKNNYLLRPPVEQIFERREVEEVDEDTKEIDGQHQYSHLQSETYNIQ